MTDRTPVKIQKLFNSIAKNYDRNNDFISFFSHRIIKKFVVGMLPKSANTLKILDLCTGTGDIAKLLKNKYPHACIIGADFSVEMLNFARKKHPHITFQQADCLNLPFEDNEFDIITISFGLRNTQDYELALKEISRVLKPNGVFLHLDFEKKSKLADFVFFLLVKIIAILQKNANYIYLLETKREFPDVNTLIKMFAKYGLTLYKRKDFLLGIISAQMCRKNSSLPLDD